MGKMFMYVNDLKEGMIIASDTFDKKGHRILKSETVLTQRILNKLKHKDVDGAYINTAYKSIFYANTPDLYYRILRNMEKVNDALLDDTNIVYKNYMNKLCRNIKDVVRSVVMKGDTYGDMLALREHDEYTSNHSIDVASISLVLGLGLGLPPSYIRELYLGALFHDIGKLALPTRIINKPGKLDADEYEVVKTHSTIGARIIDNSKIKNKALRDAVEFHHENWNGSGYPQGLVGDEIPLNAQIIHVADVYDALTTTRPYRRTSTPIEAYQYIKDNSGTLFAPAIVDVFIRRVQPFKQGSIVELSDGDRGIVLELGRLDALKPLVLIPNKGIKLDLSKCDTHIVKQITL